MTKDTSPPAATALSDLIEKLEKAEGPRRYLDAEIAKAVFGWRVSEDNWWNVKKCGCAVPTGDEWCIRKDGRNDLACNEALPGFTYSIDTALTLVPEGLHYGIRWHGEDCHATAWTLSKWRSTPVNYTHNDLAIALCIAALKAREAQQ